MVAIDKQGIPLTGILSSASTSEFNLLFPTLATFSIEKRPNHPIKKTKILIADKGYDAKWVRKKLRAKGITPYIPKKRRRGQSEQPAYNTKIRPFYRIRWLVERSIAWIGNCRRITIRYEHYSHIYYAFFKLICIML
jgi:transposase